ncbi:MAG: hypothetical protein SPF22_08180 [Candidatus Onthovivens sp.]|nr:hypothetical protein [Candidatus Onthovivens sp.]
MYINYIIDQTESILENTNTYLDSVLEKRENEIVQEGVIGTIWEGIKMLFTAVIKAIVWLWKKLVSFVKLIVDGIKWLFGISSSSNIAPEHNKMITTTFSISMNDGKEVKKEVDNKKDLEKFHMENIRNISKVIDKLTKEEIETIENYEKMYGKELAKKESLTDITLERVIGKYEYRDLVMNDYEKYKDEILSDEGVNDSDKEYLQHIIDKYSAYGLTDTDAKGSLGSGTSIVGYAEDKSFGLFDIKKAELVLQNKNFIEAYRAYAAEDYPKYLEHLGTFAGAARHQIFIYELLDKLTSDSATKLQYLKLNTLYSIFPDDEEKTKLLLQLRINMNKSIIRILQNLVKNNKMILEIDKDALSILNKDLDIRELQRGSSKTIKAVTQYIYNHTREFLNGNMLDLRKFGMGVALYSDKITNDPEVKKAFLSSSEVFEQVILNCIRYHINIYSHGLPSGSREFLKDVPEYEREYEGMEEGQFNIQAVELPNGQFVTNISDFLSWCKFGGRKMFKNVKILRVNVLCCNTDGIDIPRKFKRDRTMLISSAMTLVNL